MPQAFDPVPVTFRCPNVTLEPLEQLHAEALLEAGRDESIWQYMATGAFSTLDDARVWIAAALAEQETGSRIAFAIVDAAGRRAIGSTSYLDIRRPHRALEIGWTWITPAFQRTAVNTQCKRALLAHAFETLGAVRVQFKTDLRNVRSQRAIERLGAVGEGVLRRSMILPGGYVRDSVYYSIVDAEWPDVKKRLKQL
jgi:N-acetyltransferase